MRQFTCIDTSEIYSLVLDDNHDFQLIKTEVNSNIDYPIGTEINGFYLNCVMADIKLKFNDGSTRIIKTNQFIQLSPANPPTHKMFVGFDKRFKKY